MKSSLWLTIAAAALLPRAAAAQETGAAPAEEGRETTVTSVETQTEPVQMMPGQPEKAMPPRGYRGELPGRLYVGASWEPAIPIGSFNRFIDNFSGTGINGQVAYFVHPRIALGGEMSFNAFRDDTTAVRQVSNFGAFRAHEFRYIDAWSTRGTARYYFTEAGVQPFVGIGLGISTIGHSVAAVDVTAFERKWVFAMTPELGVLIPLIKPDDRGGLLVTGRYNFTTDSYADITTLQFVSANVGFYWRR
jgi:opacity protein-like surface antigen